MVRVVWVTAVVEGAVGVSVLWVKITGILHIEWLPYPKGRTPGLYVVCHITFFLFHFRNASSFLKSSSDLLRIVLEMVSKVVLSISSSQCDARSLEKPLGSAPRSARVMCNLSFADWRGVICSGLVFISSGWFLDSAFLCIAGVNLDFALNQV